MKYRHKAMIAKELTGKIKGIDSGLDGIFAFSDNLDPSTGQPLGIPLADVLAMIKRTAEAISKTSNGLSLLVSQYPDADHLGLTGIATASWADLVSKLKVEGDLIFSNIDSVKNETQLRAVKKQLTNTVPAISVFDMGIQVQYANIVNDLLDASYYSLRNINPDNGAVTTLTDAEIKAKVLGYLNQIPNFLNQPFTGELETDMDSMVAVADYVKTHLNDTVLLVLSDYIGANVEKLPLVRRLW